METYRQDKVKVSIITVSYNSSKTIEQTIRSVLGQTYKNIEYIVVDGASTDKTIDIVKAYEGKFGGRLRWISQPDAGIYDAMNKGISMATGELVGIINSDDWYEETAVEDIVNAYSGEEYVIMYGMMKTWQDEKLKMISWMSHEFLDEDMIAHPACFVSKGVYKVFDAYDTTYKCAADYDFMLKMARNESVSFKPVDSIVANFRLGGACASGKAWMELVEIRNKYGLIDNKEYKRIKLKDKIYRITHGNK